MRATLTGWLLLALLSACARVTPPPVVALTPSATFLPAATGLPPTPLAPGEPVEYRGWQVMLEGAELTQAYDSEFGTVRQPSGPHQFLWVQIRVANQTNNQLSLPRPDHFSALYLSRTEYKPIYGRRLAHPDYLTLTEALTPTQALEAWLCFEVPAEARLDQFWFAYLPESIEVSFTTAHAPVSWAEHPLYLWNLSP